MKGSKKLAGVRVSPLKNTKGFPTQRMPVPSVVRILMSQHMGSDCEPLVNVGDYVRVGQKIGDSSELISAPIHSSTSGFITAIEDFKVPTGKVTKALIIESDGKHELSEDIKVPVITNREEFIAAVRESGLVGLGGAGFPTHVKYSPENLSGVDTLLINAAECEPYITSDNRTITEVSENMVKGINATLKYLGIKHCLIGMEDHKSDSIMLMKQIAKDNNYELIVLPPLYPQGAERVMIYNTLGRVVPEGKLPADIGVIMSNVATVAVLGGYLETGMPLTARRVTVDGGAIASPKTVLVPIGTSISELVEFAGGYGKTPAKIVLGGPMMGIAIENDDYPITKQNNAIIAFAEDEKTTFAETQCIRCGECMRACPVDLMPFKLKSYTDTRNIAGLVDAKVNLCIECGCCSYVCPAYQELVASHKKAKRLVLKNKK